MISYSTWEVYVLYRDLPALGLVSNYFGVLFLIYFFIFKFDIFLLMHYDKYKKLFKNFFLIF